MRTFYTAALLVLFAVVVFADDHEDADEDADEIVGSPLIVIHKTISEPHVKVNGEVKVTTVLSNQGDAAAFNVVLKDKDHEKKADALAAGESLEITYTVAAGNKVRKITVAHASATYNAKKDAKEMLKATSNQVREEERDEKKHAQEMGPRGFVSIVSDDEYERLTTRHIKEMILFAIFAAIAAGFPFMVYRQKQMQVDLHLRESRKKQ